MNIVQKRGSDQKFRRRGFALGVLAGALYVAWKVLKYPGSFERRDAMLCLALVLSIGLVGGLLGWALGKMLGPSDRKG